jgi:hypothetical protein
VTDPRLADVTRTRNLISRAQAKGWLRLPLLSAAEICVLCGSRQALIDETEWRWWTGLSEDTRSTTTTGVLKLLASRELIRRAPDENGNLPMVPELAVIVTGRQHPSLVVTCDHKSGEPAEQPRYYGLAERDDPPPVLVHQMPVPGQKHPVFGQLHEFVLVSPDTAGDALASWASIAARFKVRRAYHPATVSAFRHAEDAGLRRDTLTAARAGNDLLRVSCQRSGQAEHRPVTCDREQLARLLTVMLTETRP